MVKEAIMGSSNLSLRQNNNLLTIYQKLQRTADLTFQIAMEINASIVILRNGQRVHLTALEFLKTKKT